MLLSETHNDFILKKTSNALSRDLGMFVYFMIILHHIHLILWSNFWSLKKGYRLVTSIILSRRSIGMRVFPFPKLKTSLSGRRYMSELTFGSAINKCLRDLLCISNRWEYISGRDVMFNLLYQWNAFQIVYNTYHTLNNSRSYIRTDLKCFENVFISFNITTG